MLKSSLSSYNVDDAAKDKNIICFSKQIETTLSFSLDQRQTLIYCSGFQENTPFNGF